MLRIGIQLAACLDPPGEFLADARAFEAAGADSLWLCGDEDLELTAAAAAAVTGRVRLVIPMPAESDDARARRRLATLWQLSRARLVFRAAAPALAVARAALAAPLWLEAEGLPPPAPAE